MFLFFHVFDGVSGAAAGVGKDTLIPNTALRYAAFTVAVLKGFWYKCLEQAVNGYGTDFIKTNGIQ